MKEIKVNLPINLAHGTLLWIYASNNKVFHSSKRFDVVEFTEHDSNYLGEIEDVFPTNSKDRASIKALLKQSERVYGIYLDEEEGQAEQKKDTSKVDVLFFTTWDKMQHFAEDYFETYDQQESKRKIEVKRRIQARNEWLERGKRFLQDSTTQSKEM